jgi:putative PIN family toxin of toxin-antitoxin system
MTRVVLDTNVIASALLSPHGNPAKILALLFSEDIQVYYCDDILAEYEDVLSRPSLKINAEKTKRFLKYLKK